MFLTGAALYAPIIVLRHFDYAMSTTLAIPLSIPPITIKVYYDIATYKITLRITFV